MNSAERWKKRHDRGNAIGFVMMLLVGGFMIAVGNGCEITQTEDMVAVDEEYSLIESSDGDVHWSLGTVRVIRIDECEYVMYSRSDSQGGITHKGNCDNPAHQESARYMEKQNDDDYNDYEEHEGDESE